MKLGLIKGLSQYTKTTAYIFCFKRFKYGKDFTETDFVTKFVLADNM